LATDGKPRDNQFFYSGIIIIVIIISKTARFKTQSFLEKKSLLWISHNRKNTSLVPNPRQGGPVLAAGDGFPFHRPL
jgi:hypothetical protein